MSATLVTAAAVVLTGCSISYTSASVSAEELASQAATALFEQTPGAEVAPEVDCGDGQIALSEGLVVYCLLMDPVAGLEYDMTVTISNLEGSDFEIDMQVAAEPNNAPAPEETSDTLSVSSAVLADLATGALEPELGYAPTINCSDVDVPLVVGEELRCGITGGDGPAATVLITITEVEGTEYSINAKIQ